MRLMKKYIIIILLFSSVSFYAQAGNNFPSGLGLEVGFGSNELLWGLRDDEGDRSVFNLSLSSRIYYKIPLSASIKIKPFLGYIRFGGLSEEQDNGYKDEFYFDAFELGGLVLLEEKTLPLNFGLGLKGKRYFNATGKFYGGLYDEPNTERKWNEEDVSSFFDKYSFNIGASVGTSFSSFYLSMEYWVGLNDFKNKEAFEGLDNKIKENHYRLFMGY